MYDVLNTNPDCCDCVSYIPHYVKLGGRLRHVSGHCVGYQAGRQLEKTDKPCKRFLKKISTAEKQDDIKKAFNVLTDIQRKVSDLVHIFMFLASDNDNQNKLP